jgi:hypothetical protein
MKLHRAFWAVGAALTFLGAAQLATRANPPPATAGPGVSLSVDGKAFLTQEPILATVRVQARGAVLPAAPGEGSLRFEITPAVKPRANAKPLPLEGEGAELPATVRTYDLVEWFQFPVEGTWTVKAVAEHNGTTLESAPLKISIARPAKGAKEQSAVDRLHHLPWSNYTTNAFCGDCFDLVKQWPDSRLARYAHYWNGVFHQNKKEYDKAIASYRTAAKYAGFVLADHAEFGVVECLVAQKNTAEAARQNEALSRRLQERDGKTGASTVLLLSRRLTTQALSASRTE